MGYIGTNADTNLLILTCRGRDLGHLTVDGFKDPFFDRSLLDRLVMKSSTKELIKDLTEMYVGSSGGSHLREEKMYKKITEIHKQPKREKADAAWSADFISGKGEGLTILLHGGPGVGKTFTAGKLMFWETQ